MKDYIQFLLQHWILASLFLFVLLLIILYEIKERISLLKRITPQELIQWINEKNAVVIDLREAQDFSNGHITEAKNLSFSLLKNQPSLLDSYKNKPLIFVTETGEVPLDFIQKLKKTKANDSIPMLLAGGIKAWKNAGLPLVH
ncbi:MAG: rhodanese-like domain-containing protein [Gammaproteobacteria bacterium]|nr:rhodanese-like domain-containing protein [Gammaproteobacteria bacterium]